jgi:hypothetical protein
MRWMQDRNARWAERFLAPVHDDVRRGRFYDRPATALRPAK